LTTPTYTLNISRTIPSPDDYTITAEIVVR